MAEKVAGKKIPVSVVVADALAGAPAGTQAPLKDTKRASEEDLREEALTDPGVQALFEIFPVEKAKIEEM